ncbi:DUF2206 domain-containing protein [Pyrococcus kukulkanii]|uniref:DUF2206 domain-containing protein n=1 Tax=Pyrococcus kukulkanii TaxID=1609559 RepID=UPI00356B0B4B
MKNDPKHYFGFLLFFLLVTDVLILSDFPVLRQVFAFVYFTFVPGLLILHILKLERLEFLKKFVLSIGLSVAFLMFGGLFVNSLYPYISRPLSLIPLLVFFNIAIVLLTLIAYYRNRDSFDIRKVFNFNLDLKGKLISPMLFPILFPFLAVFGTYLMNTEGNNIVLLIMLALIPAYVTMVVLLEDRIPKATYPLAIWMITLSLLLMLSLRTSHIMGGDIHREYYVFKLALRDSHWEFTEFKNPYNACLSITILPTVYQRFLGLSNSEYIYKLVFQVLISIIPLVLYLLYNKFISRTFSFISALLFASQFQFIYSLALIRTPFAMIFFSLSLFVWFSTSIELKIKKALFMLFIVGVIISHYSTGYLTFLLLLLSFIIFKILQIFRRSKENFLTVPMIIFIFALIVFWYGMLTTSFNQFVYAISEAFISLFYASLDTELYHPSLKRAFGIGINSLPEWINLIVYYIILGLVGLGVLKILIETIKGKHTFRFPFSYISLIFSSGTILGIAIIVPYISEAYGPDRVLMQSLVILAPILSVGIETIIKPISFRKIVSSMIVLLFLLTNLGGIYQIFGIPHSIIFNSQGFQYNSMAVHDQEIQGAEWLKIYKEDNAKVCTDRYGTERLIGRGLAGQVANCLKYSIPVEDNYLFLRYYNVIHRKVVPLWKETEDMDIIYSKYFQFKNKIYDNNGSEVWR